LPGSDVIVFGGYGIFGSHVVRELALAGLQVTIAGRNRRQAEAAAHRTLGDAARGIQADLTDFADCRSAIEGHRVVVNAAGPFCSFASTLIDACLATGCHHVDLADDRDYVAELRKRSSEFARAELCAAYGCSSLPGISGAVATRIIREVDVPIDHARITLFIGNRNPKGGGAVRSAAASIGKTIAAPQGSLVAFGDPERVPLFQPYGKRRTLNFNSPDYDLLPAHIGLRSLSVKVGFELSMVTSAFGFAARYAPGLGRRLFPALVPCSKLFSGWGSSGGQVMVELFSGGSPIRRGAVVARSRGQRMAALPAVYAAKQLCDPDSTSVGAVSAYDLLGARKLVDMLVADGYEFLTD